MAESRVELILPQSVFGFEVAQPVAVQAHGARGLRDLPRSPNALVGREKERETVRAALREEDVFLVTITGTGGVGKTRLAVEVARDVLEGFDDGVAFVPLAPLRDPELVASKIAQAVSLTDDSKRSPLEQLLEVLRAKRTLLVLDNFEHVLAAAPVLGELLRGTREVKVLVTSRAVLHLEGEREVPLPPLALPDPNRLPSLDRTREYSAVALFVNRARKVRSDFRLTEENVRPIAEICVRLDGLPLALELAAARTKLLTPAALLRRLDESRTLLSGGARDRAPHQQALRATIEWSRSLLEPLHQRLFARISVFRGGFTLEAAEAICADEDAASIVEGIAALLEHSLLHSAKSPGDEPRFAMLATIREAAAERLGESGEEQALRRRHTEYFLAVAERAEPEVRAGRERRWIDLLEVEHDNLRTALSWALDRQESELSLRLGAALWRFWRNHGHLAEGRQLLEEALAQGAGQPPTLLARAYYGVASIAFGQGDLKQNMSWIEESLNLAREVNDFDLMGWSLIGLANAAVEAGDVERALVEAQKAVPIFEELKNDRGVGFAYGNLGYAHLVQRDYERAGRYFNDALALLQKAGDRSGEAWIQQNLGFFTLRQGRSDPAAGHLEEALRLADDVGLRDDVVAYSILGTAAIAADRRDWRGAARLLGAGEALREAIRMRLQPVEAEVREQTASVVQTEFGTEAFAACVAEGKALTVEQVIHEAVRALRAVPGTSG